MKKLIIVTLLFCFICSGLYAQNRSSKTDNKNGQANAIKNNKTVLASSIVHSFDVLNYKLDLDCYNCFKTPYPNSFSGVDKITFKADSTLNYVNLNAVNYSIDIDSVLLVDNFRLNFSHTSNILTVVLNKFYNPGEVLSIKIYYRHKDVIDSVFSASNGLIFTDCEPEGARYWFPCWDKPSDKATTDITVKTPSNVLLGSNGRLADSIRNADTIYYHWVSSDPMSTYLVSISGSSNYKLSLQYWHKLSNPSDSIPIRIYYNSWRDPSVVRDSIKYYTNGFSQVLCEYPFEKIGFADVDSNMLNGCMENQTLIAVFPGSWNFDMASHEFGHHWFGDLITCATWADIWLNESFATYCEALLLEYLGGPSAYQNRINEHYNYYRNANNNKAIYNPLFINYTPPKGQIFDELFYFPVVYSKGGCVLYMLRHVLGDTMFFNVLRSYLNDPNFRFKNATTDDFTAKINQVTGQDYTWFIDEWIKQRNHPKYYNVYKKDSIGISQWQLNFTTSQDLSFSPFHKMPIELKVMFPNNTDTLLKVLNEWNGQNFTFNLNRRPDSVQFDPGNKIILKETRYDWITGSVSQCSSTAPKPITDNNITKDTIEIFQNGIIKDIKVNLNISHQNDGDLTLILRNPSFGNLTLSQFNGEGGQNFINTIFDDTAALSITQGIPPYTGRYKPQSGLSLFYNKQLSGKWILQIFDNKTGNQGTLLNWCIQVAYYNPVVIKETETEIVKEFKLFQNYPNPFNPVTNIRFDIPKSSFVSIKVYDITGKDVETIVNENIQAGKYETQWDGSKYSSGVYFYKINVRHGGSSTVDYMDTKRMILIK